VYAFRVPKKNEMTIAKTIRIYYNWILVAIQKFGIICVCAHLSSVAVQRAFSTSTTYTTAHTNGSMAKSRLMMINTYTLLLVHSEAARRARTRCARVVPVSVT
jgi:hypothetical protein